MRRASSAANCQPLSWNSSIGSTRMPLRVLKPHMSGSLVVPRMPIWITRFGSINPSSVARRNGAP